MTAWFLYIGVLWLQEEPLHFLKYFVDFFEGFNPPFIFPWHMIWAVLVALFVCGAGWGAGRKILSTAGLDDLSCAAEGIVAYLVGMLALGMSVFCLGILGLLYKGVLIGLLVAAWLWSLGEWKRLFTYLARPRESNRRPFSFILLIVALLFILALLYASTPATQSDGIRYHYTGPQEYLKAHCIYYIPLNAFTNFPFLIEMLYVFDLGLFKGVVAKLIHCSFLLICVILVYVWGREIVRRYGDSTIQGRHDSISLSVSLAALVFIATPSVLIVGAWSFIDLGIVAYCAAMVYLIYHWSEKHDKRLIILAGAMGGAALGSKYTMLLFAGFAAIVIFSLSVFTGSPDRKLNCSKAINNTLLFCVIAGVLSAPWFLKNVILTGNPVYPFAYGLFEGGDWNAGNATLYGDKLASKGLGRGIEECITAPFNTAFQWHYFGEFNIGIVYLLLLPLLVEAAVHAFFNMRQHRGIVVIITFITAFYIVWFFTYQSNRFLFPLFLLCATLIPWVLLKIRRHSTVIATIIMGVLLYFSCWNGLWAARWILAEWAPGKPRILPVVLGFQSQDEYLSETLNYYPCVKWLNEHSGSGEKTLFIGEHRGAHCTAEYLASDWYDTPYIIYLIRKTTHNTHLFALLREWGVRYILFNYAELKQYEDFFRQRFNSSDEYIRYTLFIQSPRLKRVYPEEGETSILEIDYSGIE